MKNFDVFKMKMVTGLKIKMMKIRFFFYTGKLP